MRQHCVGQLLLFISEKQGTATTKSRSIIYLDYLVLVKKKKKKVSWCEPFVCQTLLFINFKLLTTQLQLLSTFSKRHDLAFLQERKRCCYAFLQERKRCCCAFLQERKRCCYAFLQERIQRVTKAGSLTRGRAQKVAAESKKVKLNDFWRTWNEKLVISVF